MKKDKRPAYGRNYFRRRQGGRTPAPRITIFCDDTKTAPAYFGALKAYLSGRFPSPPIVKVHCAPHQGFTHRQLIEFAQTEAPRLHNHAKDGDSVWVLFDLEDAGSEPPLIKELRANSTGPRAIRPVVSKPCFEVWTLHHLMDTGQLFQNCGKVNTVLEAEWRRRFCQPIGTKAQADYAKIVSDYEVAAKASRHQKSSGHCYSEVFLIIDAIRAYLQN